MIKVERSVLAAKVELESERELELGTTVTTGREREPTWSMTKDPPSPDDDPSCASEVVHSLPS